MELLHDTHFWFLCSFVAFMAIAWKFGRNSVLNTLDSRIEDIKREIETAENLRIEAQELLAQYQRKHRDAVKESEKITASARKSAEEIRHQAEADLAENMQRREKQLEDRLERMKQSAIAEIQQYAADLASMATVEIITRKLDKKTNERLVNQAIKDIGKNLN